MSFELESDLGALGRKWLVDFKPEKTQLVSFDRSYNTGDIDARMNGSLLEKKNDILRCWG